MESAAPTATAIRAMGILMSQTITRVVTSADPGMRIVEATSQSPSRAGPRDMSSTRVPQRVAIRHIRMRYLRPVIWR